MKFTLLIPLSVITLHLVAFELFGFQVTVGALIGALVLVMTFCTFPTRLLTFCALPVIALTGSVALAAGLSTGTDFFSTLILIISAIVLIGLTIEGSLKDVDSARFRTGVKRSLGIIVIYASAQVGLGALGSATLFNPWRDRQFAYNYNPLLEFVSIPRAQGFYLEPSYLAFVVGSLATVLLVLGKDSRFAVVFGLGGMAVAQSAIGLAIVAVAILAVTLRSGIKSAVTSVALGAMVLLITGKTLAARFGSVFELGSSGNYRLIQPIELLRDVLTESPFGMPLGSVYDAVRSYRFEMYGAEETRSLDNGFYLLVYYFGFAAIIMIIAALAWVSLTYLSERRSKGLSWLAPFWIVVSFSFSGGIFAPDFIFMISLVILAYRLTKTPTEAQIDRAAHSVDNHGDIQRSSRPS